jgi:hypothetical protein
VRAFKGLWGDCVIFPYARTCRACGFVVADGSGKTAGSTWKNG